MSPRSEQDFWRVLTHIAENMKTDEETEKLGLELGIPQYDIDGSRVANRHGIVYEGTFNMLKKWSRLQHQETSLRILRQALERVGRIDLCESMDRGESTSSIPDVAETESSELKNHKEELDKLKDYLQNYRQIECINNDKARPEVVHIGLYGEKGSGKSALANSLKFAFTGTYDDCANEMPMHLEGTRYKQRIRITEHIHIIDSRGMIDVDVRQISDDIIPQICGKRGVDFHNRVTGGIVIHCPVFVWKFAKPSCRPKGAITEFIINLDSAVLDHYGRHLMVAIIHEKELQPHKDFLRVSALLPKDHVWVFENYTLHNHEHNDEKSIAILKFLKKCVNVGERNIDFEMEIRVEK
eukprot:XP_003731505.1 PREDICTED: uncharacterized protein LOC100891125 [Strongylocentrotus purpuratus]